MIQLTPSESKYLSLLSYGLHPEEISKRFKVTPGSLRSIFNRIRRKTGLKSNTQLVSAFLNNQLTRSK